jgi:hypothetical protein
MARGALSSLEKKLWQKFVQSQQSPVEQAKAKLRASAKHAMSRRGVGGRRKQQPCAEGPRLIDATRYGTPFVVTFYPNRSTKKAPIPVNLACSYRLLGDDLEVTIPIAIDRWRDWAPQGSPALTRMIRYHRRGTHVACAEVFRRLGYNIVDGGVVGLKQQIDAIGCVRIGEERDRDSSNHELHFVRDGGHDVYAGMTRDKNGTPIWQGQNQDHENKRKDPDCVQCQYNQIEIDNQSGVRVVFRFKPGMAPRETR